MAPRGAFMRLNEDPTTRVRRIYDRLAPRYDRVIAVAERLLFDGGRQWASAAASGRCLEVAIGTGRNLQYCTDSMQLVGLDVSPGMLEYARVRADVLGRSVELQVGDAQRLPYSDASFDTVVATLSLCSIPDDHRAVREMARVLVPGGRLVLLDHVASPVRPVRALQRILNPVMVALEGDHLLREPDLAVRAAGLAIEEFERSKWGIVAQLVARKPH